MEPRNYIVLLFERLYFILIALYLEDVSARKKKKAQEKLSYFSRLKYKNVVEVKDVYFLLDEEMHLWNIISTYKMYKKLIISFMHVSTFSGATQMYMNPHTFSLGVIPYYFHVTARKWRQAGAPNNLLRGQDWIL